MGFFFWGSELNPPAFQLYADDFIAGTMILSQSEVGAYMRLLCHQWSKGGLPNDAGKLERLAGGPVSDDVLAKLPVCPDGLRRNVRLEQVRKEQAEFRQKQSKNGKAGADARWHRQWPNDGDPNGQTMAPPMAPPSNRQWRNDGSPSPSPSPSPKEEKRESNAKIPEAQLPLAPEPEQPKAPPTPKAEAKPDSLEAVHDFFTSNGSTSKEADKFHDFFASNGWKVSGKAPMKDWHAAARNWMRRASEAPRGPVGHFRGPSTGSKSAAQENIDQLRAAAEEDARQMEASRAARLAPGAPKFVDVSGKFKW